jgi:hypothetical protein
MSSLLDDLDALSGSDDEIVVLPAGTVRQAFSTGAAGEVGGAAADLVDGDSLSSDDSMADGDAADGAGAGADGAGAGGAGAGGAAANPGSRKRARDVSATSPPRDAALDAELASLASLSSLPAPDALSSVARLRRTRRFAEHLSRVEGALAAGGVPDVVGPLEEWPEYAAVVASSALLASVDDELHAVWRFAAAAFAVRFPELETVVPAMADFMRVVEAIGERASREKTGRARARLHFSPPRHPPPPPQATRWT